MKKELDGIVYDFISPTGNMTILVESDVDKNDYADVAKRLMKEEKRCEQVGFVMKSDKADIKLCMAAGEFCGNATMSAAALFADKMGFEREVEGCVNVETDVFDDPVPVYITLAFEDDGKVFRGRIKMPLPGSITEHSLSYAGRTYKLPVVSFDGISHIIASSDELGLEYEQIEEALRAWSGDIGSACVGIMVVEKFEDKHNGEISTVIRPLVYAPDVETLYWESSCASGTTALGAYYKRSLDMKTLRLMAIQPGGYLTAVCDADGTISLEGRVRL